MAIVHQKPKFKIFKVLVIIAVIISGIVLIPLVLKGVKKLIAAVKKKAGAGGVQSPGQLPTLTAVIPDLSV